MTSMGDAGSLVEAARSALAAGNTKDAYQHVKAALKADPGSYDALLYVH